MNTITVVGEALVDIVRRPDGTVDAAPGGSPANVALTLGRRGRAVTLRTCLGNDERGEQVRAWLAHSGVDVVATHGPRTSTAIATLDASGSAHYTFDLEWDLDPMPSAPVDVLHVGSVAAVIAPGADVVSRMVDEHRATALVTYDPNIRPVLVSDEADARRRIEALAARADVVKVSDEDLAWIAPGQDPRVVAETWIAQGVSLVVITLGGDGARAFGPGGDVTVSGVPVTVVDTVGAGDTFMGTLIGEVAPASLSVSEAKERLRTLDAGELARILEVCAAAAAVTVSRQGADPPWPGEAAPGTRAGAAGTLEE